MFGFASCNRNGEENGEIIFDGFYIVGTAVASSELLSANRMHPGFTEGEGFLPTPRSGMHQSILFISAEGDFRIVEVRGADRINYGATLTVNPEIGWAFSGDVVVDGPAISVAESGLHLVYLDFHEGANRIFVLRIDEITAVGDGVHGPETELNEISVAADRRSAEWRVENLPMRAGWWKFRFNRNWVYMIADETPAFTNIGGTLGAPLTLGGANLPDMAPGLYTLTLRYQFGTGLTATATRTGDGGPVEHPEEMFMIGDAFGGWDWNSDGVVELIPVTGMESEFWTIRHFEAGVPFKFNSVREWGGDFYSLGENTGLGVHFDIVGGNVEMRQSGIFHVHIDMVNNAMAIEPARVYLIGYAIDGNWDVANPDGLFDEEGNELVSPVFVGGGAALRMFAASSIASHPGDWWRHEFIVRDGVIEYRGSGGDQHPRVPAVAGQQVRLNFNAGTGTIN